jgi:serine/threonine protein kinase
MTIGLNHKNIIRVHTAVEKSPENESAYIVMEHLTGGTLKDRIEKGLPYTPSKVIREIASALDYCYKEKEIIHRDLKPSNILFRESSTTGELIAVLTDFGISRKKNENSDFTLFGVKAYTPKYASPEQIYGDPLTQRSDLYSLGIIFYEMLVGSVPYQSNTETTILKTITKNERPKLPTEHAKYQPIINNLLSSLPEERFINAQKLIAELDKIEKPIEKTKPVPLKIIASLLVVAATGGLAFYMLANEGPKQVLPMVAEENEVATNEKSEESIVSQETANSYKISQTDNTNIQNEITKVERDLTLATDSGKMSQYIPLKSIIENLTVKYPNEDIFHEKLDDINFLIDKKISSTKKEIIRLESFGHGDNFKEFKLSIEGIINDDYMPKETKSEATAALDKIQRKNSTIKKLDTSISLAVTHPFKSKNGIVNPSSLDDFSNITLKANYPSYLLCIYHSSDNITTTQMYPVPKTYKNHPFYLNTKEKDTSYKRLLREEVVNMRVGEGSPGVAKVTCFSSENSFEGLITSSFKLNKEDNTSYLLTSDILNLENNIQKLTGKIYGKTSIEVLFK